MDPGSLAGHIRWCFRCSSRRRSKRKLRKGRADGAFVDVINGGTMIPEDLAPSLFEPFRRLDGQTAPDGQPAPGGQAAVQDGAGLGLSIVQSVAAAHGGVVSARSLAGGGLGVFALLPSQPAAHDRPGPGAPPTLQ
ncbi:MAG: ATP-binding protein [Micromonosporaceae bacterium]